MGVNDKNVTFVNARIVFRNFAGVEKQYNDEGKRNFALVLTPDQADAMEQDGWNIKRKPPREEGEDEFCFVPVTVSFKGRPPRLVMITSRGRTTLDEETAEMLDYADIANVDLIIRPYDWVIPQKGQPDKTGRKAYLHAIYVTIDEDELELKYANVNEIGYNEPELDEETFE